MSDKEILKALSEIQDESEYMQDGDLTICKAIIESGRPYLLWKALCVAHRNGMIDSAQKVKGTSNSIINNMRTSQMIDIEFSEGD